MSDPFLIPSIISGGLNALGSLAQGGLNYQSQRENKDLQIQLANTAIQRRMEDLKKAGINPLLAGKIGGAETPTLQAPQMTGIDKAVSEMTPTAISGRSMQLQQQQMQINQTQAETQRIQAEKDKAIADALLTKTQTNWYDRRSRQELNLMGANEREAIARTRTIDVTRQPQVRNLLAETALKTQQQKSEIQRTREMTEAANNAKKLYGARASEAFTIAEQTAANFAEYWRKEKNQNLDKTRMEIELINDEHFQKVIDLILRNKYGDAQEYANIFKTPWQLPAAFAKDVERGLKDSRVIKKDFSERLK